MTPFKNQACAIFGALAIAAMSLATDVVAQEYPDNPVPKEALIEFGNRWLDALEQGDPFEAPLADGIAMTVNARPASLGRIAKRVLTDRRFVVDAGKGQVAVYAFSPLQISLFKVRGPRIYHARLRVEDGEITEIEAWDRPGPTRWESPVNAAESMSRQELGAVVHRYFDAVEAGDPNVPFAPDVARTENGVLFVGQPSCLTAFVCAAEQPVLGLLISHIDDRRMVVDTDTNTVVAYITMYVEGEAIGLPMAERFRVEDGLITEIESLVEISFFTTSLHWVAD